MNDTNDMGVLETAASTAASIKAELSATADGAMELTHAAGRLVDARVRARPWHAAAIALGLGFIAGMVVRAR